MAIPTHGFTGPAGSKPGLKPGLSLGLALGLISAFSGIGMAAEPVPPARVGVFAKHIGNKIVYHYQVTNQSQLNITAVSIGYDTKNDEDPGNDVWELSGLPSGWNVKYGIPAASSNSPTGWRVNLATPGDVPASGEEHITHAVSWEIANDKSPVLASGQTTAKMSIALDKADAAYLTGHALVTFSDGLAAVAKVLPATGAKDSHAAVVKSAPAVTTKSPPFNISVPIEPLDSSPPVIVVTLTPNVIWSDEDKHMAVNATFAAKVDDFDNLPEIKLESITASESLEPDDIRDASYGLDDRYLRFRAKRNVYADRVYTVTYSATDASGNQSTASATVTVSATVPAAISPVPVLPASTPLPPASATSLPASAPASALPASAPAPAQPATTTAPPPPPAKAPQDQGEKGTTEAR